MARKYRLPLAIFKSFTRSVSLYAQGKPVTQDHLFRYNTGRFIVNEDYELAKRYSPFDIDELCEIVASQPSVASPIRRVEKKEGGYNKALLMTAENGRTVIAKVPCRKIVPRQYGTASEVAVLSFVKKHSSTPVSEVLTWSADENNPARTEYIVLEKSTGRQLSEVWDDLKEPEQSTLIRKFAGLESKLAMVDFPGYGALYLRDGLPAAMQENTRIIDVDDTYCLGPMYHGSWPGGYAADPEEYAEYSGPWRTLTDLARDLVRQGIWQIEHFKTSHAGRGPHYGTPEEHLRTLNIAMDVMPMLTDLPALQQHGGPVLCHPDFHPGNIFVSRGDPTIVNGIVDWQFASILPQFTNVRWPFFLNCPTEGYRSDRPGSEHNEHTASQKEKEEAMRAKCYEATLIKTRMECRLDLPELDVAVRELFTSCSLTYRDGILPVRDSLVKIFQYWSQLGTRQRCPYHFSPEQIAQHEMQFAEYQDWLKLREYIRQLLKSNDGGWIEPGVDFEETKKKHEKLYWRFVKTKMKYMSEEEAKKLWFFRERS